MAHIRDPNILPTVACHNNKTALVEDENIKAEIQAHLQRIWPAFSERDIVDLSSYEDVMVRSKLSKPILQQTARRWLKFLGYNYQKEIEDSE